MRRERPVSKIGPVLVILSALTVIISVSFGGHIYRWEMIIWASVAGFLALRIAINEHRSRGR
jgi:hypothetical protein